MTMIDHERCSELLGAHLEGTLSRDDAAEVEAHLASCEKCRAELAGLNTLRAADEVTLTTEERARLERGVMAKLDGDEHDAVVTPLPRRPVGARVAQVLGAAAVVTAIATFVYFNMASDEDAPESAGRTTESFVADDEGGTDQRRGGEGRGGARLEAANAPRPDAAGDVGTDTTSDKADRPAPTFIVARDPYTSQELEKLGAAGVPTTAFAQYYRANDTTDRDVLLDQLAAAADDAAGSEIGDQITDCGRRVLQTEDPIVPTFGAVGELDRSDVVIIGFAWSGRSSGPLDRYMVWAWQQGDCDVAVEYIEGRIENSR